MANVSAYDKLQERFQRLSRIEHAMSYLGWDQMVMMPSGGMQGRADAIAELAGIHHDLLTATDMQSLFNDAKASGAEGVAKSLQEMQRLWQQETCLPAELVKARVVAGSRCEHGWRTQKAANDWSGFLANFEEVVALSREEARLRQEAAPDCPTPYDALLAVHCTGDSHELVDSVFDELRVKLPELSKEVMAVQKHHAVEVPAGEFDVSSQLKVNEALMHALGFDFAAGRLDQSMHPFSMGSAGDLRITTRFREDEFLDALMATAHETGHASYESGLPGQWSGLPVGQHRNMCIHESQSLLFEKQIFLSLPFLKGFLPTIKEHLPQVGQGAAEIWNFATRVEPEYIRVEANEVTYPLHVLLRYEIEQALINGDIEARDIPELWRSKLLDFMGLDVGDNHAIGCLQDIHWSDGTFGYFPSYTVGAVNAAQLFAAIKRDHPNWQERFQQLDVMFVREWLQERIWSKGRLLTSQEIMQHASGEATNSRYFLEHLHSRYIERNY